MKIFSSFFGLLILAFVVLFILSNREPVVLSLWPFSNSWDAPLYVVGLAPFALGGVIGLFWGLLSVMPHKKRAKSLNKELSSLNEKIGELQKTSVVQQAKVKPKSFWKP